MQQLPRNVANVALTIEYNLTCILDCIVDMRHKFGIHSVMLAVTVEHCLGCHEQLCRLALLPVPWLTLCNPSVVCAAAAAAVSRTDRHAELNGWCSIWERPAGWLLDCYCYQA
jgi:hypothetical protein